MCFRSLENSIRDMYVEGVIGTGRITGSRSVAFRQSSKSNSTGEHDHGIDIGARRNYAHEIESQKRSEDNARKREQETQRRAKEAEKRQKLLTLDYILRSSHENVIDLSKQRNLNMTTHNEEIVTEETHVFHVHMKPTIGRQHRMVDDNTSEPIGDKPKGDKLVLKVKAANKSEATNKAAKHVAKNYGIHNVVSITHKGLAEETNTEKRMKIKNVARPDDAAPISDKSTLGKTGQIKTKVIDEAKPTMSLPNFGLSASLIETARQIVQKKQDDNDKDSKKMSGGKTAVDFEPETNGKIKEAKLSPAEFMKGTRRAGTGTDDQLKADAVRKNAGPGSGKIRQLARDELKRRGVMKEQDVEQVDEVSKETLGSYVKKVAALPPEKIKPSREKGIEMASKKLHKEDVEQVDEVSKETLGSYVKKVAALPPEKIKPSREKGIEMASKKLHKEDARKVHGEKTQVDTKPKLSMQEKLLDKQQKISAVDFKALHDKKCSKCGKIDCDCNDVKEEVIDERELTPDEMNKREKYVKSMKPKLSDFEKRYPGRGKDVMHATATKMAKEEIELTSEEIEILNKISSQFTDE